MSSRKAKKGGTGNGNSDSQETLKSLSQTAPKSGSVRPRQTARKPYPSSHVRLATSPKQVGAKGVHRVKQLARSKGLTRDQAKGKQTACKAYGTLHAPRRQTGVADDDDDDQSSEDEEEEDVEEEEEENGESTKLTKSAGGAKAGKQSAPNQGRVIQTACKAYGSLHAPRRQAGGEVGDEESSEGEEEEEDEDAEEEEEEEDEDIQETSNGKEAEKKKPGTKKK